MPGKTTVVAELKVSPLEEAKKDCKAWVNGIPELKKLFSEDITHESKLELDGSKWNEKKLSKALFALVLYELKYIASGVALARKEAEKSPDKLKGIVDKTMPALLADARKLIRKKIKSALEELSAGGDDDSKKVLKQGKEAIKEIASVELKGLFADRGKEVGAELAELAKQLTKAADQAKAAQDEADGKRKEAFTKAAEKKREDALKRAVRAIGNQKTKYKKSSGETEAAITELTKLANELKNVTDPESLTKFAAKVAKRMPDFETLKKQMKSYETEIEKLEGEISEGTKANSKLDGADVGKLAAAFEKETDEHEKAAKDAKTALTEVAKAFKDVEKDLK